MAVPPAKQRPTLAQALVLTIAGIVTSLFAMRDAMTAFNGAGQLAAPFGSLIVLGAGALMFSAGLLMLLVVVARPLFAPRPQDERAAAGASAAPRKS